MNQFLLLLKLADSPNNTNQTKFEDTIQKDNILSELFAKIGNNVKIDVPFYCDYGQHISIGNNVIININCTFVDCNKITIGNNV